MRRRVKTTVAENEAGMPVLDFLARRYLFKEQAQWLAALLDRAVILNGEPAGMTAVVAEGDVVLYQAPEAPEPAVDTNISLLFEDEHLIAVNKPGNLPCHPSGCYYENTLWYQIRDKFSLAKPHLINRLDRETSGVVLVAKTEQAARDLSRQFFHHRVKKIYSVIVEGWFPEKIAADGWLMPDAESAVRKKRCFVKASPDLKPCEEAEWAQSRFELIQRSDEISLVRVQLLTGRLHQIRATLCSLGFPVVGDKLYGVNDNLFIRFINGDLSDSDLKKLRMERQALHAQELHVTHPATGSPLVLNAPVPGDMCALVEF